MADFTLAQIGEKAGGTAPPPQAGPEQAVQQPSPITAAVNFASGIGASLFDSMSNQRELEQQTQVNKAIGRFSEQQMRIAEMVDQGRMSSQEARMRMRRNLIRSQGDNPNLGEGFRKAHESIIETAGMGKVAAVGTEQEQAFMQAQSEALKLGFFTEGSSEEVAREGTQRYIQLQQDRLKSELAKEELSYLQAKLTYQRGQVGLASDQIGLETSRINLRRLKLEQQVQEGVVGAAESYFPVFSNRLKMIQQRAQDPSDPMTVDEANLLMRQELDQITGEARARGATMDATTLENILAPYRNIYETQTGVLTGKISGDVAAEVSESAINQTALAQLSSDPEYLATVATAQNLGSAAGPILAAQTGNLARDSMEIFQNLQQENGRYNFFSKSGGANSTYLEFIGGAMDRVASDKPHPNPEGAADEVRVQTNSMLQGLSRNIEGEDFERWKPFIDHIASDTYANYITGKGKGAIDKQNEAQVQTFLSNYFLDEIQPLIEEEWANATTRTTPGGRDRGIRPGPDGESPTQPTSSLIRPFFTGDGVRFMRSGNAEGVEGVDAEIQRLNNKVAPAINVFLRAGAHLGENTDYERMYMENFSDIFGVRGQ